jgi:hypothetical protein
VIYDYCFPDAAAQGTKSIFAIRSMQFAFGSEYSALAMVSIPIALLPFPVQPFIVVRIEKAEYHCLGNNLSFCAAL